MKKLINEPGSVLDEMLQGIVAAAPALAILNGHRIIVRTDYETVRNGHVALISGGGSGHEPAHAGYIGPGMLTAAVCGEIFTSPSTDAVLTAIRTVTGPAGALLIVKNYTGDRLNFGLAAEIARSEGFLVDLLIVDDDAALRDAEGAGRRGLAGTVLIHKVAGAAAAAGLPLDQVRRAALDAVKSISTMGVALRPCTMPGTERSNFNLGENEVEFGLGIHGESGRSREQAGPARAIVEKLCSTIFDDLSVAKGDRLGLFVNNLGATPPMELSIVAMEARAAAHRRGVSVERLWVGTFLTALDMAGCSITAIKLSDPLCDALDAKCNAPAWPGSGIVNLSINRVAAAPEPATRSEPRSQLQPFTRMALEAVANALVEAEPHLTELDRKAGDGDLGINLARGASKVQEAFESFADQHPGQMLKSLSALVRQEVGGTSGALYAAGLLRAASAIDTTKLPSPTQWADALNEGAFAVAHLGDAAIGDCTMLDALVPAATALREALASSKSSFAALDEAILAGEEGARRTETITARRGRSSYIGNRALGTRDPGAEAVVIWLKAIAQSLEGRTTKSTNRLLS